MTLAVFFLGTSPGVDLAGAELLEELYDSLRERCAPVVANQTVATVIERWRAGAAHS